MKFSYFINGVLLCVLAVCAAIIINLIAAGIVFNSHTELPKQAEAKEGRLVELPPDRSQQLRTKSKVADRAYPDSTIPHYERDGDWDIIRVLHDDDKPYKVDLRLTFDDGPLKDTSTVIHWPLKRLVTEGEIFRFIPSEITCIGGRYVLPHLVLNIKFHNMGSVPIAYSWCADAEGLPTEKTKACATEIEIKREKESEP